MNILNLKKLHLITITIIVILLGCENETLPSGENTLTAISINDGSKDIVGNIAQTNITFNDSAVAGTSQVTVKAISFSPKASANVNRNDTIPIDKTITITAENGSTKNYTMTINVVNATMTTSGNGMTTSGDGISLTGGPVVPIVVRTITGARIELAAAATISGVMLSGHFMKVNNPFITELGILMTTNAMLDLELNNANAAPTGATKNAISAASLMLLNNPMLIDVTFPFAASNLIPSTPYYFRGYATISGGSVVYTNKIKATTLILPNYINIPDDTFRNAIVNCINTDRTAPRNTGVSSNFPCAHNYDRTISGNISAIGTSLPANALLSITQFQYIVTNNDVPRIYSLSGIEWMTRLTSFNFGFGKPTDRSISGSSLDFSANTALTALSVTYAGITGINIEGITSLRNLQLWNNSLTSLDISNNTKLFTLNTGGNPDLTCIVVSPTQIEDISMHRAVYQLHSTTTLSGSCL